MTEDQQKTSYKIRSTWQKVLELSETEHEYIYMFKKCEGLGSTVKEEKPNKSDQGDIMYIKYNIHHKNIFNAYITN